MQKFLYPRFRSFQCFSSFSVSCFVFLSFSLFFSFFFISWRFIYGDAGPNGEKTVVISKKTSNRTRRFFLFWFFMHCEKNPAKSKSQSSENLEIGPTVKQQEVNSKQTLGEFLLMTQNANNSSAQFKHIRVFRHKQINKQQKTATSKL